MKTNNLWWLLFLKGLIFLLFGFAAIAMPGATFVTLAFVFSIYILISGVLNVIHGISGMSTHRYWLLLLAIGIFEIGVGAFAFSHPVVNVAALVLLISATFIIRGILELGTAFDSVYSGFHRVILAISGVLGIAIGLFTFKHPVVGGVAFTWVLGIYALIGGAMLISLSLSLKDAVYTLSRGRKR